MGDEDPKSVWESEAIFQKHKLANFRACYNNLRKEGSKPESKFLYCIYHVPLTHLSRSLRLSNRLPFLGNVDDSADAELLNRRSSVADELRLAPKKRRLQFDRLEDVECDDDSVDGGAGVELTSGSLNFKPLYLLSRWVEPGTMTNRVTAAILLPSGVGSEDFFVRVVDGGEYLELTVVWPPALIDLTVMNKKWLIPNAAGGFQLYHPKMIGFEMALKELRSRSSDLVESVARIPLPFPVQSHIDASYNLAWKDSEAKMVYVDLKAFIEDYSVQKNKKSFEAV